MYSYKSYVFVLSIYYGLLAIVLPIIYAVTNQLSIFAVFSMEWFSVSIFLYPLVLIMATVGYFLVKKKKSSNY